MTMTPAQMLQLVENAPQMDGTQRSIAFSALAVFEDDDRETAAILLESMSAEGLARFLRDLKKLAPIAQSKLMQK